MNKPPCRDTQATLFDFTLKMESLLVYRSNGKRGFFLVVYTQNCTLNGKSLV